MTQQIGETRVDISAKKPLPNAIKALRLCYSNIEGLRCSSCFIINKNQDGSCLPPTDPTNSFVEIVQIGRNFVHHKDVTLYYNSGHGRGGRQSVIVMCFVLCVS